LKQFDAHYPYADSKFRHVRSLALYQSTASLIFDTNPTRLNEPLL